MSAHSQMENPNAVKLARIGEIAIRYSLVVILLWVGGLKFTTYEADGIKGMVENSPLLSWGYPALGVQGFSDLLGIIEISLGIMIATRYISPKISSIGSFGAIFMLAGRNGISISIPDARTVPCERLYAAERSNMDRR